LNFRYGIENQGCVCHSHDESHSHDEIGSYVYFFFFYQISIKTIWNKCV